MSEADRNPQQGGSPLARALPGVSNDAGSELAVALVIAGGLGTLYAIRKGLVGIGDLRLTGSTVGAIEWLAYAAVVGGTLRVLSTQYPDNPIIGALGFVY